MVRESGSIPNSPAVFPVGSIRSGLPTKSWRTVSSLVESKSICCSENWAAGVGWVSSAGQYFLLAETLGLSHFLGLFGLLS